MKHFNQKKIGNHWFSWGWIGGFSLGITINRVYWSIDLGIWYVGGEF